MRKVARIKNNIVVEVRDLDFEPHITDNWHACPHGVKVGDKYSKGYYVKNF